MKRSGCGGSDYYSPFHNLNITMDESELEAAVILLELPYLMAGSEPPSRHEFSLKWGATRKRSSLLSSLQSQPSVPVAVVGPTTTPTPTPTPSTCETEKEKRPKALSPASPLLFSPSESDEKTKHHSKPKLSLKRVCFVFVSLIIIIIFFSIAGFQGFFRCVYFLDFQFWQYFL